MAQPNSSGDDQDENDDRQNNVENAQRQGFGCGLGALGFAAHVVDGGGGGGHGGVDLPAHGDQLTAGFAGAEKTSEGGEFFDADGKHDGGIEAGFDVRNGGLGNDDD